MLNNVELAKAKLALYAPEFISLTSKLEFVPTDKVPTAGTDGRHLYYNPAYTEKLTLKQTIGLILHEVGHNMLAHPARIAGRDEKRANIATDIANNYLLEEYFNETKSTLGAEFPPGDTVPGPQWAKYKGWNWEKIYHDLEESGDDKGTNQFDNVTPGAHEDGSRMTPSECEALAKEWTMAAQQAATMAKARGLQSGMFEEFVSGLIKTRVDWRSQLWDVFVKVAKDDQSWRKFNRKLLPGEIYMPGLYSEHIGTVAFFADTSGSMGSDEFKAAMGGINEILDTLKPEKIIFGQCDTRMQSVEHLTPDDLPVTAREFKGRGGTVLRPIFDYIKDELRDETLELVVILTDGGFESDIPKNLEPNCPVVWLVTTEYVQAAEGTFGKVIRVEV